MRSNLLTERSVRRLARLFVRRGILTSAAAAIAFGLAGAAHADVQLYDGFDYPAGTSIRTQGGGTGWLATGTNSTWTNTGAATENATSPGMTYGTLAVTGNKAELTAATSTTSSNGNSAFIRRDAAQTFGTDNTTLWVSFLGQRTGTKSGTAGPGNTPTYHRVFGISFFNDATENFSIGELSADPADVWSLNPTSTSVAESQHTTTPIDTASFILARITYGAANADSLQLWVNPDLTLGEAGLGPAAATIASDDLTFNGIRLSAGGSQSNGTIPAASGILDELRVGDTFADVTPTPAAVPEPAAMTAIGLGALALLPRRRRHH